MAVYQDKAKDRIRKQMNRFKKIIDTGVNTKMKEADTRQIVVRILSDMLGWSEFENLTGEFAIKGGFADFMLTKDGVNLAVIEIKPVSIKLNENHVRQARDYAFNDGIEWVILTNANEWRVYRTSFAKNAAPELVDVFTVKTTDEVMKLGVKADLLYLLSEEAMRKDELGVFCDRNMALSRDVLVSHLMDKAVLDKLRIAVKRTSGHSVTNHDVAVALVENVIAEGCPPGELDAVLRKVKIAK